MSYFSGTASFYSEFRPGYPGQILDYLTTEAKLDRSSKILDLGAGPATTALEFAKRLGSVVAVDLDGEMLEEGRRLTEAAELRNVEWVNAAAETVDYPEGHFQLVVIASAFQWMDRPLVASGCRSMLADDGLLAVLGNPTPLMQIRECTAIGAAIGRVQNRWFGDDYYVLDIDKLDPPDVVLRASGLSEVTVSYVPQVQEWNVHRFLGFLRSTSSRPDQRLGEQFTRFAEEIDSAIRAVEPSGRWTLEIPVEMIVGRK